jgi:transcriptional regulator with XRE-family HTH domain
MGTGTLGAMRETDAGVGRVVRSARQAAALSQESLADLARINRTYLGQIERGEASPSVKVLEKIARALGLKLSQLISEYEHSRRA